MAETDNKARQKLIRDVEMQLNIPEANDFAQKLLRNAYERIIALDRFYLDDKDESRVISGLWTMGTYVYKVFPSFPRLFINAMKGSGKTRRMKLIEALAWNGALQASLREAVLFRTASQGTILLDEAEKINTKDQDAIRELLNAGYKRGNKVKRMKKVKGKDGEEQVVETFDVYGPVALANINGMEDVLADRSITIIMEKSNNASKVNLVEDFNINPIFFDLKRTLNLTSVYLCTLCSVDNIQINSNKYTYTLSTQSTLTSQSTQDQVNPYAFIPLMMPEETFDKLNDPLPEWQLTLFQKVKESGVNGRQLELFMPLFIIANALGDDILSDILAIAKERMANKKKDEMIESRDVALLDFVSRKQQTLNFIAISDLLHEFKQFYMDDDSNIYITSNWVGKALKRLDLIIDRRRLSRGYEVVLNVAKAKDKIKMFKEVKVDGE